MPIFQTKVYSMPSVVAAQVSARSGKGLATPLGEEDETEGAANAAAARAGNSIHFSVSISNGCCGK